MLWRGLEGVCWRMGGEGKRGQTGVESWLPTLPYCQSIGVCVCVCAPELFFFLSPLRQMLGPMQSCPMDSWPPPEPVTPCGTCTSQGLGAAGQCGRERQGGACCGCWQYRTFPCSGKPQSPQCWSRAVPQHAVQLLRKRCSRHATRT